jgi:hypothetical protein
MINYDDFRTYSCMSRELFFASPNNSFSSFWTVDEEILLSVPRNGGNRGLEVGRPSVAVDIARC